jgi:uncharacterized protein (TIGR02996 family)
VSQHDEADLAAIHVLQQLLEHEGIEFVSSRGVSGLASAAANFLLRVQSRPDRGAALAAWLIDQDEVRDLYVDDDRLEQLLQDCWDPRGEHGPQPPVEARRADLEAMLQSEPDNLEHRLVYGDWLQAHQDPFGELITRQIAAASEPDNPALERAASSYASEHAEALFGPLAEYLGSVVRPTWRGGFIEAASLGKPLDDPESYEGGILLRWLLEHRAAMLLRELELQPFEHYWNREQYPALLAVVLERPRPLLRRLTVGNGTDSGDAGELARLDELLPNLEILELRVRTASFDQLRHPKLRRLVWTSTIGPKQARALTRFELPRLESLVLGSTHPGLGLGLGLGLGPDLESALLELPSLRSLQTPGSTESLDWLAHVSWRDQLEQLDLSGGTLTDDDVRALTGRPWPNLRRLDVSNNQLGAEGLALVASLCPEVVCGEQRPVEAWDDYDPDDDDDDDEDDEFYDDAME